MNTKEIRSAEELKEAMRDAGSHYWDADTMRFFRSRGPFHVTPCAEGVLFCTSEQFVGSDGTRAKRKWSVRLWTGRAEGPDNIQATVREVGEFNAYTRHEAIALLKRTKRGEA